MRLQQDKNLDAEDLAAVLQEAASDLGADAVATAATHPGAVRAAPGIAADVSRTKPAQEDVLVITGAEPALVDRTEAERWIAERARPLVVKDVLTTKEVATRVGLKTRQAVHDWLKQGRIVGWEDAKDGYVFPSNQFDDRGRPLRGLARVMPHFSDGLRAWWWLTGSLAVLDGAVPLALLRRGETARVVAAAMGYGQGDFM